MGSQGLAIGGDTLVLPDGASKDLVVEEVGHLMQAGLGSSGGGLAGMSGAGDAAELEARNAAHEVASGGTATLGQSPRARMAARPGDAPGIDGDLSHGVADWIQKYLPYNSWGNAGADLDFTEGD